MDRRGYLAVAAGLASTLAGCSSGAEESTDAPATDTPPVTAVPMARQGYPPSICEEERRDTGIEAIVDPKFGEDWTAVDPDSRYGALDDSDVVIGIEHDGRARAYPIPVLTVHEVVNDEFGGPLLVTFCPLCDSGMVAERTVGGEPTPFGVSGLLWKAPGIWTGASEQEGRVFGVNGTSAGAETSVRNNGNLVLYDRATASYWSQMLAEAICGPRRGERLAIRPSTTATWGDWREAHPAGEVLLPPPHSTAGNPPVTGRN